MIVGAARNPAIINKDEVFSSGKGIVGGGIDRNQLDRGDNRSVGGETVEAEIGGGKSVKKGEDIRVGTVTGGGFRPWRTPTEQDGGTKSDVEGGRASIVVIVIVNGEGTEEVASRREGREGVAVFLAVGGGREEAEGFFRG